MNVDKILNSDDIEVIAERAFNNQHIKIIDFKLSSYSNEKIGFLGEHKNLTITIKHKKNDEIENVQLFVKALPNHSEEQSQFIRNQGIFNKEALFLNSMVPLLKEDFIGEDWGPKCYLANDQVVVLEDLRRRGFSMLKEKIFQGNYLKSASKAQARLHASSILSETKLEKPLNEICPGACKDNIFNNNLIKYHRLELYTDLAVKIAKKRGIDHRRIKAALNKGFFRLYNPKSKKKFEHVISHGDCWPNNYLFDTNNPPNCVLVDFQLVRYAPRMFDVALLIYLSTTRSIREIEERGAIEAYHEELCDILKRNHPTLVRPSLEELLDEYEDVRMTAILICIIYYPIVTMDSEELHKYQKNQEALYKKVMFRDNNDTILEMCQQYAEYNDRLTNVVEELVEYSEKLCIPTEEDDIISTN